MSTAFRGEISMVNALGVIEACQNPGVFIIEVSVDRGELPRAVSFLENYFSHYSGHLFDGLGFPIRLPLPSSEDGQLLNRIEEFTRELNFGPGNENYGKLVFRHDDTSRVMKSQMLPQDQTQANQGESNQVIPIFIDDTDQKTLKLASMVLYSMYFAKTSGHSRSAIVMEDSHLDIKNSQLLLQYLNRFSTEFGVRTFLFAVNRNPGNNSSFYCLDAQRVGIQYDTAFVGTNSFERSRNIAYQVAVDITAKRQVPMVVFLGSGAAIEGGMPSTRDLLREGLVKVLHENPDGEHDVDVLSEKFREKIRNERLYFEDENESSLDVTLERVIAEEIRITPPESSVVISRLQEKARIAKPSRSYIDLCGLLDRGVKIVFVTSNYDDLLERAMGTRPVRVAYDDNGFGECIPWLRNYATGLSAEVPILKIHGDLSIPQSIRAASQEVRRLPGAKARALTALLGGEIASLFASDGVNRLHAFFIGYGFGDKDVMDCLRQDIVLKKIWPFVVNPNPREEGTKYLREVLLSQNIDPDNHFHHAVTVPYSSWVSFMRDRIELPIQSAQQGSTESRT